MPTDTLILIAGFWILCGIAALLIAQSRGLSGSSWFVTGLILGPIGILLALTAKPMAETGMVRCGNCGAAAGSDQLACPRCRAPLGAG